jgi:hypothetical protein
MKKGKEETFISVPVGKIISESNRKHGGMGNIDVLAESIKVEGLISPPTVVDCGDGTYRIVAGRRRIEAVRQLKWKEVMVRVVAEADADRLESIGLSENVNRQDAIEKDIYIIEGNQYTATDLKRMSLEDLESFRMRIDLKISSLSLIIKTKQIDYTSGGKGTAKEWYTRHKYALSINQRVLPYIANLIKRRRGELRSISDYFMDEAKVFLKSNEYEAILKNAQHEMSLLQGGM